MIFGRFAFMVPGAGHCRIIGRKAETAAQRWYVPDHRVRCSLGLLIGVIIILGGLQFMPADALGTDGGSFRHA